MLQVVNPQVSDCPGSSLIDQGVRFEKDGYSCSIRFLPLSEIAQRLRQAGVEQAYLDQPMTRAFLVRIVAFDIHFDNSGPHNLNFNPDQVRLERKGKPIGLQVTSMDVLSAATAIPSRNQELMSRFFDKASVEIPSGGSHAQLVAFQSPRKEFPRQRVDVVISRVFYGLEASTLTCSFQFQYE